MSPPLPDELILRILSHVDPPSLLTVRQTSKQLKRCANETILRTILPALTLSTTEFRPPLLKKTNYKFVSSVSESSLNLTDSRARFEVSEVLLYDPAVPWFIGWGIDFAGNFGPSDLWPLEVDEEGRPEFGVCDVLAKVPEVGRGPWAGEGKEIVGS